MEKMTNTEMTNEEAEKYLKAKAECMIRSKGRCEKCDTYNSYDGCYECSLFYEQGNVGQLIESMELGIKALEKLSKIEHIINTKMYVQEDVLKYKAICKVIKGEINV